MSDLECDSVQQFDRLNFKIDRTRPPLVLVLEWGALAMWALYIGRNFLNLDPTEVSTGREYLSAIYGHFLWEDLKACGSCAMWFGHVSGGYPAFVDPHEATYHPVIILTTLIWGALTGAKIAVVLFLFLGGIAQWWTARVMGLGSVARVWSGALAIAAGNLSGRMEDGMLPLVTSGVSAAFMLPPIILLSRNGDRRSASLLGCALGLFILSGQAYLQIGFAFLAPLTVILFLRSEFGIRVILRRLSLAVSIGLLIAAPFLVPFLHFSTSFGKYTDAAFDQVQPAQYAPLNLVIDSFDFYKASTLGMMPYPYLYTVYIGWIAVAFSAIGFGVMWRRGDRSVALFLLLFAAGAFFVSGAELFRWIRDHTSDASPINRFIIGIRHPTIISGLAVPALLALAAYGVDALARLRHRPLRISFGLSRTSPPDVKHFSFDVRWLLAIPLVVSLVAVRDFSRQWLTVQSQPMDEISAVISVLKTDDLQWVQTPFGQEYFYGQALANGIKISSGVLVWHWEGRTDPTPLLTAQRGDAPAEATLEEMIGDIGIYRSALARPYAYLLFDDGSVTPCTASGRGGDIDVSCDFDRPGTLIVQENSYSGWSASLNGHDRNLVVTEGDWLAVPIDAGQSTVELRYRPWDVPLGIVLMLIGLGVAAYSIVRPLPPALVKETEVTEHPGNDASVGSPRSRSRRRRKRS